MFMTLEESKSKTVIGGLCRRIFWSLTINIPTSQPGMERENKRRSSHWRSDPPELASIALPRHCSTNGHQKRGKCWLSHLFQKSLVTSTPLSGTTKAPCVSTRHRSENVTEFQAILQADHLTTVPCFSPPENSSCWSRIGRRWCCCGTKTRKSWLWANEPKKTCLIHGILSVGSTISFREPKILQLRRKLVSQWGALRRLLFIVRKSPWTGPPA